MRTTNNNINIFSLTDSHQETRKLCRLFTRIIEKAPENGKNTLICDSGDLFKGIYNRELSIWSYETLRKLLPEAKIVFGLGNNDFGFNLENFKFLISAAKRFNKANIHVLCANLQDLETGLCPNWVDPYILLEINGRKIMVTSFCINQINLQRYGVHLLDISNTFAKLKDVINYIEPDALIVMNHALCPQSEEIWNIAQEQGIKLDLILGGHEHEYVAPDFQRNIYYPQAFSKSSLYFQMSFSSKGTKLKLKEEIFSKNAPTDKAFDAKLSAYEEESGLNIEVAPSTLHLERKYSSPCSLGTFIADSMRRAAKSDIAMISTGYISHALRYERGKILTNYNINRAFSAEVPLQTVNINTRELKEVFKNAIKNRYKNKSENFRFLQCSSNVTLVCYCNAEKKGDIAQIYINGEPQLDEKFEPLYPEKRVICAIDPFIGAGEQGYEAFRIQPKETLLKNNELVKIKDIFVNALRVAPQQFSAGSTYKEFKLIDKEI